MKYFALLLAAGLGACADAASTAPRSDLRAADANQQTSVSKDVVPFAIVACNGEVVTGLADSHVVLKYNATPSGRVSAMLNETDKFDGVGSVSGAAYHGDLKIMDKAIGPDETSDAKGATIFTVSSRLHLTAKGVQPTRIDIKSTFVDPGNGKPAKTGSSFSSSCDDGSN